MTDDVDGQNRSAVAAVRALAAAGYAPVVSTSTRRSVAAASRWCSARVTVPPPGTAGYAEAVRAATARLGCLAVLPASDASLVALGCPGAALVDKVQLAGRARAAGIPVPASVTVPGGAALLDMAGGLAYPVVVKSAVKSGRASRPALRVDRPDQLAGLADLPGPLVVQPFLPAEVRAVAGVVWHGRLLAAVHQRYLRRWPREAGVASAAETTDADLRLEARLVRLLATHDGVFQAQLVGDRLIDVNPRVYGSLPLAVAAGANLPAIACAAAEGRVRDLVRARPGVRYRWLEGDLRHVVSARRHGEMTAVAALRALRPHRGTAHSVESVSDPAPMLVRLARAGSRLRKPPG